MKKLIITPMLAAVGILVAPLTYAQPARGDRPTRPDPEGRPGVRQVNPEQRKQALLNRYDANENGKLDNAEYIAIGKDVEAGRLAPRAMPGRPGLGAPGPRGQRGPLGPRGGAALGPRGGAPFGPRGGEAFGPRHQELLDRYDANENNILEPEDRAEIRRDMQGGDREMPRRGPGRRGFGGPPRGDVN